MIETSSPILSQADEILRGAATHPTRQLTDTAEGRATENVILHIDNRMRGEHFGSTFAAQRVEQFTDTLKHTIRTLPDRDPSNPVRLPIPQGVVTTKGPDYGDPIIFDLSVDVFDLVCDRLVDPNGEQFSLSRSQLQPDQKSVTYQASRIPGFFLESVTRKENPNPIRALVNSTLI